MKDTPDFRRTGKQIHRLSVVGLQQHVHFVAQLSGHPDQWRDPQDVADSRDAVINARPLLEVLSWWQEAGSALVAFQIRPGPAGGLSRFGPR